MIAALWLSLAIAQEMPPTIPVAPGETVTATTDSFLIPGPLLDRCLVARLELDATTSALLRMGDRTDAVLDRCVLALEQTREQITDDGATLGRLSANLQVLQEQNAMMKRQRNVAWAATAGLVVSIMGTGAVALAL